MVRETGRYGGCDTGADGYQSPCVPCFERPELTASELERGQALDGEGPAGRVGALRGHAAAFALAQGTGF